MTTPIASRTRLSIPRRRRYPESFSVWSWRRGSERGPLIGPDHRRIDEAADAEAARKPSLDRRIDNARRMESQRQGHADRALGFALARSNRLDALIGIGRQFVEPAMSAAQGVYESRAGFDPHRTDRELLFPLAPDDLATPIRRWRDPRNGQDPILGVLSDGRQPDLDCRLADGDALNGLAQDLVRFQARQKQDWTSLLV
jgi:hypothetical protein